MHQVLMRYPGGKPKALTLSYDDGVEQDIRLLAIMRRHGIRGTFNLNSGLFAPEGTVYEAGRIHRRLTGPGVVELFQNSGMEVGVHALTHSFLDALPMADVLQEVVEDRRNLEKLFQKPIQGMAYPYGTTSDAVVEALRLAGIKYARTVTATMDFRQPTDWLRMTATCHHKHAALPELTRRFVTETPQRQPWLFFLWGHSYEFEADNNWQVIEDFCAQVAGCDDVWMATNVEIFDYTQAYNRLEYAVGSRMVSNPSAQPVWIRADSGIVEIPAGETVTLS